VKVGVIQSNYIPWRGYFDFIQQVDLFVFHDDIQYTKGDWRNRNRIKTPGGAIWLSVPVKHHSASQLICDTHIEYAVDWQRDHLNRFTANYHKSPHRNDAAGLLEEAFRFRDRTISELNVRLVRLVCSYLGIETPMQFSSAYPISGAKTERLIDLLHKAGASIYLSGPSARNYLDESLFRKNGIRLEYKTYDYPPYPQLWGAFEGAVSILDLIANCGQASKDLLRSSTPNEIVAP